MGASAERMAKENGISREDQDEWALRSHRLAAAGTRDGRLAEELVSVYVPPDYETVVSRDAGIRIDTSSEQLAARPVFDRTFGSVTAKFFSNGWCIGCSAHERREGSAGG